MATYSTGEKAPESGIYICAAFFCETKRTIGKGRKLPPCPKGHTEWELSQKTTKPRRKRKKKQGFLDSLLS
jgi:hypothetical protein